MHGGWGALTILIKKQQNDKFRKAEFRKEFKNKKEKALKDYPFDQRTKLKFPEISPQKLDILKQSIRRKAKKEHAIKVSIYSFVIGICVIVYVYYLKGGFINA